MANRGLKAEIECSHAFHADGIPLLISPLLLRSRDMGQVDLARLRKLEWEWVIEIGEVKSSMMGAESMLRSQRNRLFSTQRFLSGLFSSRSRLIHLIN